jgi:hypothetical protein
MVAIAEPILLGRVIDAISEGNDVFGKLAVWAGLGVFSILAYVLVARGADRLANRQRVEVLANGFEHVITATGATSRTDGVARFHTTAMPITDGMQVLAPEDLFAGRLPDGKKVVVYDDDHYYLGGVVAELLAKKGYDVSIVTTGSQVSSWTNNTFEINRIQRRLIENGITRVTDHAVVSVGAGGVGDVVETHTSHCGQAWSGGVRRGRCFLMSR